MIKNIIWDFDGVILDSVSIKTAAFAHIFRDFPPEDVEKLLEYHKINSGLSRFEKIAYFFSEIRKETKTQEEMDEYAHQFAKFSMKELTNPQHLFSETLWFIQEYHKYYNMHIASGAWEKDLLALSHHHNLTHYFLSIHGSPPRKDILVRQILDAHPTYQQYETCMLGDSINDYEAARNNGILYYGFNNEDMRPLADLYLDDYRPLEILQS